MNTQVSKLIFFDKFAGNEIMRDYIMWSEILDKLSLWNTYVPTFAFSKLWQWLFYFLRN